MNQMQAAQAYLANNALGQAGLFDATYNSTSAADMGIGRLSPEDASAFINFIVDQSSIRQAATVYQMNSSERRVSFIGINDNVLVPATAGVDTGVTANATVSEVVLRPQLMRAQARILDEELEDNIEGDALRADFMGLLTRKIANRLEQVFLHGVKTAGTAARIENLFQGWVPTAVKLGHVVDGTALGDAGDNGGTAGANTNIVTRTKLTRAIKAIPSKYFENPDDERFFLSRGVYQDFISQIGNRATPLGDSAYLAGQTRPFIGGPLADGKTTGVTNLGWGGYNVVRVPLMSEALFAPKASGLVTTTTSSAAAGATSVPLTSVTGLVVGDYVKIAGTSSDTGQDETVLISSISSLTINFTTTPLLYAHASGVAATQGANNSSVILCTNVKNLVVGIRRDITIEWERRPREGAWYVVVGMRMDTQVVNPDAMSVVTGVQVA